MIKTGRFREFCHEFIQIHNEEQEQKTLWEYYLHRVFEQTFEEFRASVKKETEKSTTSAEEIKATIIDSKNILTGFCLS